MLCSGVKLWSLVSSSFLCFMFSVAHLFIQRSNRSVLQSKGVILTPTFNEWRCLISTHSFNMDWIVVEQEVEKLLGGNKQSSETRIHVEQRTEMCSIKHKELSTANVFRSSFATRWFQPVYIAQITWRSGVCRRYDSLTWC